MSGNKQSQGKLGIFIGKSGKIIPFSCLKVRESQGKLFCNNTMNPDHVSVYPTLMQFLAEFFDLQIEFSMFFFNFNLNIEN